MATTARQATLRGFTILEVLIALIVMAFGLLSIAGMQLMLSRNADVAKQRSEATRLAEERIENLRAYDGIGSGTIDWNNLPTATQTVNTNTNTTFTVSVSLAGTTSDSLRPVSVTASWIDRAGDAQQVVLSSVLSKSDPKYIGLVGNPLPQNKPIKRVKNRNLNIPVPAKDLGNQKSSTQFASNFVIVYNNVDGSVVYICNPGVDDASKDTINGLLDNNQCAAVNGYIVAGYLHLGASLSSAEKTAVQNFLTTAGGMNTELVTRSAANPSYATRCSLKAATDQNTNAPIADYLYYICVVPLADLNSTWSGRIRFGAAVSPVTIPPTGTLATAFDDMLVCRIQYQSGAVTANERNEQPYSAVNMSLDEQNYFIAKSSNSNPDCPTSSGSGPNLIQYQVTGVSTVQLQQNCRGSGSNSNSNRYVPASNNACPSVLTVSN